MSRISQGQVAQADMSAPDKAASRITPALRRKMVIGLLASMALAGVVSLGTHYWTSGRFQVSTDDAYVAADSTAVAPKVSGYIKDVRVTDNQQVKAGDVLAVIDDSDFTTELARSHADVLAAQADVESLTAQIAQQQEAIAAARSTIVIDQANQAFAQQEFHRFSDLVKTGYGTVQRVQQAQANVRQAVAAVQRDEAALAAALKQSDVLKAQLAKAEATVMRDQALEQQAQLNQGYTHIVAPVDGTIGAKSLRVGAYVQAGTQLMQIVPLHAVYVKANFKETQLTNVHPGQPVDVEVDTYPGVKFAGHVDSLSPASGQEFALLPPDNATGNFTKVVQRIPVKIVLEPNADMEGKLRPGMSVEAEINTKPGAVQPSQVAQR